MRVSFDINSVEDAEDALARCFAIVDVMRLEAGLDIQELKAEFHPAADPPTPEGVKPLGEPHTEVTPDRLKKLEEQAERSVEAAAPTKRSRKKNPTATSHEAGNKPTPTEPPAPALTADEAREKL